MPIDTTSRSERADAMAQVPPPTLVERLVSQFSMINARGRLWRLIGVGCTTIVAMGKWPSNAVEYAGFVGALAVAASTTDTRAAAEARRVEGGAG